MTTDREALVNRLRERARIRRQIPTRKSVQTGEPDRIADLLDEAADALSARGGEQTADTVDVPREPSERFVEVVAKELCKHAYPARSLDEALSPNVQLWMRLKDEARRAIDAVLAAAKEGKS